MHTQPPPNQEPYEGANERANEEPTEGPNEGPSTCGVAPKTWQKKKKTITTRAEILRARSTREKKVNKKYQ